MMMLMTTMMMKLSLMLLLLSAAADADVDECRAMSHYYAQEILHSRSASRMRASMPSGICRIF